MDIFLYADKKSAGMLQPKKQSLSRAALGTESFDFYRFKQSSVIKSGILALFKKIDGGKEP